MSVISFIALYYISHENRHKVSSFKSLAHENKTYTATSSPNCQLLSTLFCPHPLHPLQICSTDSKFVPPTPNLLNPLQICSARSDGSARSDVWLMFLHYINNNKINILIRYSPHPLRSLILHIHSAAHSPLHSTRSYTVLDKGGEMHMKQSPYQFHPQQFLSSSSSFYIMLHMCILWCVSSFEKKTYSEKYEWESLLLLSELSISVLPSHSCLHVQELHNTQTHTHRHTHTHTHTQYVYYYKNVSIILMFTYENKKYTRCSKLTM